jgi:hypothetical protein
LATPERTADQRRQQTLEARRQSRYKYATDRVKRIVDGMPPLTDDQLAKLAVLLRGAGGGE